MNTRVFNHVLIPTDFSPAAENAVKHGLQLANAFGSHVTFLHVNPTPEVLFTVSVQTPSTMAGTYKEMAEKRLESLVRESEKLFPKVHFDYMYVAENLLEVVKSLVDGHSMDLVVMGTKGAGYLQQYLVGTNTATIMEGISCPVLVIPENATFQPYKKIAFATDNQFGDVKALEKLEAIANEFKAEVDAVHISDNPTLDLDFLIWLKMLCEHRMPYHNINFKTIPLGDTTLKTLNDYIAEEKIDLVALSSTNKGFLKKMFTGSLTEKMAYHTRVPFMAFEAKKNMNYET